MWVSQHFLHYKMFYEAVLRGIKTHNCVQGWCCGFTWRTVSEPCLSLFSVAITKFLNLNGSRFKKGLLGL